MKKKIMLILIFALALLLTTNAIAEEKMGLYNLENRLLSTDERCTLHMKFFKDGGMPFCMESLSIQLFDAEGNTIEPLETTMTAPINPVPEGSHLFPVNFEFLLPYGVQAASFELVNIAGIEVEEAAPIPMDIEWRGLTSTQNYYTEISVWSDKPTTFEECENSFIVVYASDAAGQYLGSMVLKSTDLYSITGDSLAYRLFDCPADDPLMDLYGISLDATQEYYFHSSVPMDFLSEEDIPTQIQLAAYYNTKPLDPYVNRFEYLGNNEWRLFSFIKNNSCKYYLNFNNMFTFYNEEGESAEGVFLGETTIGNLYPPFDALPVIQKVSLPEGFIPVRVEGNFSEYLFDHEFYQDNVLFKHLEGGTIQLEQTDGKWYATVSIPYTEGKEFYEYACWFLATNKEGTEIYSSNMTGDVQPEIVNGMLVYPPLEVFNVPEGVTPNVHPVYYQSDFFYVY